MYQFGGQCFSTKTSANLARASAESGKVVEHGGLVHVVTVSDVQEGAVTYRLTPLGGGAVQTVSVQQEPMPCQLLTMKDGGAIGTTIAAGWLVIYGIMTLLKAREE